MFERFWSRKVKSEKLLGVCSAGFLTKHGLQPTVCSNRVKMGGIQVAESEVERVCW